MLPHIRLLHLICKPYQNLEWDEFSVTTKNELLCIFHSPDLMELYVAGMKLLPASLALYPPSKLKLSNVSFGNISEVTPLESNIPSYHPNLHNRLQYLDAWSSQSINRVMTGLFNPLLFHPLFCLRELDIGQLRSDEDIEACRKALIYAKDLELLILRIHPSHSLKHLDFLSPAFALRRVQLYLGGTWSSSMRWVDCSLKTLPPNNIMKEIFVEINDDVDFHDDTWISLDKSLSGGVLRCLERFSIYLFAYEADLPERPGLSAFFSNKVPGLSSKGFFSMFINNNPVYP
ncbi:hypothetical protein BDZ94DRAFT_1263662 [Collybia nuda]|uniref:Uncharacterized protein n=1 Tax=Collybia nuda TaxID=64659 RepID=A0A9P5Y366_9AGAR|nr:hypothetical protein BDZ94DRAFT_1263662 [Collybia nuda]